jgi:cystathionine beta-lyase/cystathionine gamma-synthase
MTHSPVSEEALAEAGIKKNLIRLSVGLESSEDLISDLLDALEQAQATCTLKPVATACG